MNTNIKKKSKRKRVLYWIKRNRILLLFSLFFIVIIVVPFIINESYKTGKGYITVWNGNDVLEYSGIVISSIGTIVLGIVAWKQNIRLIKLEESTFLSSNSASALLVEAKLGGIKSVVGHLGFHEEQIVYSQDILNMDGPCGEYRSIELTCKFIPLDESQHITLVNVKKVLLSVIKDENRRTLLDLSNTDNNYTRVAISNGFDRFKITIILTEPEKQEFVNMVDSPECILDIDIELFLVTNKYVRTDLLCRASLRDPVFDENEGVYCNFKTIERDPPMCFWQGANIINKNDIQIKQLMGGVINGQDEDGE